jgi:hypothetical protein
VEEFESPPVTSVGTNLAEKRIVLQSMPVRCPAVSALNIADHIIINSSSGGI